MPLQDLHHLLNAIDPVYQNPEHQQLQRISELWIELVGAAIAEQTCPIALQRNTLQVAVSNSVWTQTLLFERPQILRKIHDRLNLILTDLRFSTAQWHQKPDEVEGFADPWETHPSRLPEKNCAIENQLTLINDPTTAFQKWSNWVQKRSQNLPLCPSCGCPTPAGELERWSVCSLCIAKH